jgi:hypothetical protein
LPLADLLGGLRKLLDRRRIATDLRINLRQCCGGRMIIVDIFERGATPRGSPPGGARVSTATP